MILTSTSTTTSLPDLKSWEGAFWKVFSMGCFAGINGIVRYCSGGVEHDLTLPIHVIVFFQNLFGSLLLLPWLSPAHLKSLQSKHISLHLLRVTSAVMGIVLWYYTLKVMPIAEGIALTFTGPIFTVIGAWLILHESITLRKILAISISFIGAFIISRPDLPLRGHGTVLGLAVLFPLGSAMILSFSKLMTRKLAHLGESPLSLATYLLIFMTPISLPLALHEWVTPVGIQWLWLIALGLLSALAHLTFGMAYRLAEVTFLSPFGLAKLMFGMLIGYLFFQELPNSVSLWVGIIFMLISMLILNQRIPLYSSAKRFKSSWFKNKEKHIQELSAPKS